MTWLRMQDECPSRAHLAGSEADDLRTVEALVDAFSSDGVPMLRGTVILNQNGFRLDAGTATDRDDWKGSRQVADASRAADAPSAAGCYSVGFRGGPIPLGDCP